MVEGVTWGVIFGVSNVQEEWGTEEVGESRSETRRLAKG